VSKNNTGSLPLRGILPVTMYSSLQIYLFTIYRPRFPLSALNMLVRWQEGHPACKKLGFGMLVVTIWL